MGASKIVIFREHKEMPRAEMPCIDIHENSRIQH